MGGKMATGLLQEKPLDITTALQKTDKDEIDKVTRIIGNKCITGCHVKDARGIGEAEITTVSPANTSISGWF